MDSFSEFSDTLSGQITVTLDLSGAKLHASQKNVMNYSLCIVAVLHYLQKLFWSESSSTFQKVQNVYLQFIGAYVKGGENTSTGVHILGFH